MAPNVNEIIGCLRTQHMRKYFARRDSWMIDECQLPHLSNSEIKKINEVWPFVKVTEKDLVWQRVFKKEIGFNPLFLTDYQLLHVFRKTNVYKQVVSLEHKAMFDVYFPDILFPQNYIKSIQGVCWMGTEKIALSNAIDILANQGVGKVVVKPTVDTGGGKGVQVLDIREINPTLLGKDFVIQEFIQQHPDMAALNPTSINGCRVTSIFLDGKFSYGCILKIGKEGSKIDNWKSSYLVGVNKDGTIKGKGYDNKMRVVNQTDNGIVFEGLTLPNYSEMIAKIQNWHQYYFPQVGIVGWDVFIDVNNQIRVIEVNLTSPGIVGEQLCAGPFIGEQHDAIINLFK